jgi:hypothetical protein
MAKAQVLIAQWHSIDNGVYPTTIITATNSVIETGHPYVSSDTSQPHAQFSVICSTTGDTGSISVAASYYGDIQDKHRLDHLLAYLLEQYVTTLPAGQQTNTQSESAAQPTNDSLPTLPDDLEAYFKLLRSQLAAGQYNTALSTIDSLKSAVMDKQKENAAALTGTPGLTVLSK